MPQMGMHYACACGRPAHTRTAHASRAVQRAAHGRDDRLGTMLEMDVEG